MNNMVLTSALNTCNEEKDAVIAERDQLSEVRILTSACMLE